MTIANQLGAQTTLLRTPHLLRSTCLGFRSISDARCSPEKSLPSAVATLSIDVRSTCRVCHNYLAGPRISIWSLFSASAGLFRPAPGVAMQKRSATGSCRRAQHASDPTEQPSAPAPMISLPKAKNGATLLPSNRASNGLRNNWPKLGTAKTRLQWSLELRVCYPPVI